MHAIGLARDQIGNDLGEEQLRAAGVAGVTFTKSDVELLNDSGMKAPQVHRHLLAAVEMLGRALAGSCGVSNGRGGEASVCPASSPSAQRFERARSLLRRRSGPS